MFSSALSCLPQPVSRRYLMSYAFVLIMIIFYHFSAPARSRRFIFLNSRQVWNLRISQSAHEAGFAATKRAGEVVFTSSSFSLTSSGARGGAGEEAGAEEEACPNDAAAAGEAAASTSRAGCDGGGVRWHRRPCCLRGRQARPRRMRLRRRPRRVSSCSLSCSFHCFAQACSRAYTSLGFAVQSF